MVSFAGPQSVPRPCFGYPCCVDEDTEEQLAPSFLESDFLAYHDQPQPDSFTSGPTASMETIDYPRVQWLVRRFTPWKPGTPDHSQWAAVINDDVIAGLSGISAPDIIFIANSNAWPNYFFCVGDDPHPEAPAVYSTDHETLFREIDRCGDLADFLHRLLTVDEYVNAVSRLNDSSSGTLNFSSR